MHLETGLLHIDLAALQAANKQCLALPGNLLLISSELSHLSRATPEQACVLVEEWTEKLYSVMQLHLGFKFNGQQ